MCSLPQTAPPSLFQASTIVAWTLVYGAAGALGFGIAIGHDLRALAGIHGRAKAVLLGLAVFICLVCAGVFLVDVLLPWTDAVGRWYTAHEDLLFMQGCSLTSFHAKHTRAVEGLSALLRLAGVLMLSGATGLGGWWLRARTTAYRQIGRRWW